jgi:hypothetical protein
VKFDTTRLTYQMQFLESSVPTSAGQVNDTRAGLTISGAFHHPTNLPTAEQNRCAFVLDSGATSDGAYSVTINRADPPMLFVGNGVVGGGIPGATIAFPGIELLPGCSSAPCRRVRSTSIRSSASPTPRPISRKSRATTTRWASICRRSAATRRARPARSAGSRTS